MFRHGKKNSTDAADPSPSSSSSRKSIFNIGKSPKTQKKKEASSRKSSEVSEKSTDSSSSEAERVTVKVGMVGDASVGKTTLMVKYVEGKFDESYTHTLGVNYMEKRIQVGDAGVNFSIWDLGGEKEFISMLPLVCNGAVAMLFMFDLTRRSTLESVKDWYRQVRAVNKNAFPFLLGTKYDEFACLSKEEQAETTKRAKKFAKAMDAPLIFNSASHSVNVQKTFKIILSKVFNLECHVPTVEQSGDPILMY